MHSVTRSPSICPSDHAICRPNHAFRAPNTAGSAAEQWFLRAAAQEGDADGGADDEITAPIPTASVQPPALADCIQGYLRASQEGAAGDNAVTEKWIESDPEKSKQGMINSALGLKP
jgi:hypothetical protein